MKFPLTWKKITFFWMPMQRKKAHLVQVRFWAGVILFLSSWLCLETFWLSQLFRRDRCHWYLVSKRPGMLLNTWKWFLKNLTMQDTPPIHTMIQPELSVVPRMKDNSVCPPLPGTFVLVLTPSFCHRKPFPPQLLLHTPLFSSCLCPLLTPIITSNRWGIGV